jgi:hypothetical protein
MWCKFQLPSGCTLGLLGISADVGKFLNKNKCIEWETLARLEKGLREGKIGIIRGIAGVFTIGQPAWLVCPTISL